MKEKSNKGLIVVIIILVVALLAGGIFVAYDKGIIFKKKGTSSDNSEVKKDDSNKDSSDEYASDGNNKNNAGSSKTENLSLNDSRFINLYNALEDYTYEQNRTGYESFTKNEIAKIVVDNVEYKASDFVKTNQSDSYGRQYYTISASLFENKAVEIFGDNITFNKQDIVGLGTVVEGVEDGNSGMQINSYDQNSDKFFVTFGGIGSGTFGAHATLDLRKLESAVLENDAITLKEKAIYVDSYETDCGAYSCSKLMYSIYGGPNKFKYIDEKTFDMNNVSNETISVSSYLDKASTITHVYKLNSKTGKYYFEKSTIE